jgi:hypothetical protein
VEYVLLEMDDEDGLVGCSKEVIGRGRARVGSRVREMTLVTQY